MRTDRSHTYFEGEKNPNLQTMTDILMTYNMYNFDLGINFIEFSKSKL
jgi:hypothetical protein